jgi:aldehyde dehydrogenase (NAD+)
MGPLVNTGRVKAVHEYTEIGKLEGARLVLGGSPLTSDDYRDGAFYKPTIFTNVGPSMRIATEEIFGPFVSIVPVATYEEAIKVANSTEYGLSTAFTESTRLTFAPCATSNPAGLLNAHDRSRSTCLSAA